MVHGDTAFLSTFPPRRCGIATFTHDLAGAIARAEPSSGTAILAMTDADDPQVYPECVRVEIRKDVRSDYVSAAGWVNDSRIRAVSIQHEYGIFGGDDGEHVLDFVSRLDVPAIATLHTVLKSPSPRQRSIVEELSRRCARLVVMSEIGVRLLAESYGIAGARVVCVPHGIPDLPRGDSAPHKATVGAAGRRLLLTFGLLNPNKGIETVIRAMPRLVERFPDLMYMVVGATHPEVRRRHGEAYRESLEAEAKALGVSQHVVFRNRFVDFDELCSHLQAADIYVTSYLNEAQSTSGALAYAMGAGAAVVSTPYWHAQEWLAEGRGRLFPVGDVDRLVEVVDSLLSNETELQSLRAAAYEFTRPMTWARVGETYAALINEVTAAATTARPRAVAVDVTAEHVGSREVEEAPERRRGRPAPALIARSASQRFLPELRLDHLLRLTDDTGIIQHATFSVPSRSTGYCVDDNARALLVVLLANRFDASAAAERLIPRYVSFLHHCQREDGRFHNFVDYSRVVESHIGSQDCIGRALWALGATVRMSSDEGVRSLARSMFNRAVGPAVEFGPRGQALAIMGLAEIHRTDPESHETRGAIEALATSLCERFDREAEEGWRWFEPLLTYDNALIPLALFTASDLLGDREHLRVASESLQFLEELCFPGGRGPLRLIGNRGWHQRGREALRPESDEQPIDAAAFVLAFRGAFLATGDRRYLRRMRESFEWFLGGNRLGLPLYDESTAGCRDGLGIREASQNQGAESTVSFLTALLTVLESSRVDLPRDLALSQARDERATRASAAPRNGSAASDPMRTLTPRPVV